MFLRRAKQTKRDVAIGLDLGRSRIKAAVLRHQGETLQLSEYAILPTANGDVGRPEAQQQFAGQLQQLMSSLSVQERRACVTISSDSAIVCETEFPRMPMEEVKSALKLNSSRYLRRDFSNYYLDAIEVAESAQDSKEKKAQTMKVLVGGAIKQEVLWYRDALLAAKIRPEVMELAAVSVINAFQVGNKEICEKEVVVLVDIGARSTSINFLRHGQPLMTRITHFGGCQISEYLAQMLAIEAGAAEEEKLKMSDPVQPLVRSAIVPLAKEVRSSIDFFERQHECHVTKAFACGGSACAPSIIEFLSDQVGTKIECWNPIQSFETSHFNGDSGKLLALAPSLAAAVGAAAVRF